VNYLREELGSSIELGWWLPQKTQLSLENGSLNAKQMLMILTCIFEFLDSYRSASHDIVKPHLPLSTLGKTIIQPKARNKHAMIFKWQRFQSQCHGKVLIKHGISSSEGAWWVILCKHMWSLKHTINKWTNRCLILHNYVVQRIKIFDFVTNVIRLKYNNILIYQQCIHYVSPSLS
jgi:hypothetical protein